MVVWQRVFNVCFAIFLITFTIAVIAIFTNSFVPDEIFDDPAYLSDYVGVRPLIGCVKAIDTADFYATVLFGIASGVTYLGKQLKQMSIG